MSNRGYSWLIIKFLPDSSVAITPGVGANVDTRTAGGEHRQVIIIGHESATDSIATVQATDPGSDGLGLVVREPNTTAIVSGLNSVRVRDIVTGTITTVGAVTNITNSIAVVPFTGPGSPMSDNPHTGLRVVVAGTHAAASLLISGQQVAGTNRPLIVNTDGAVKVYDIVTGTIAAVTAITNALPAGDNNIGNVDIVSGTLTNITNTVAVYFDRGDPGVKLTSGILTGITNSIAVVPYTPAGTALTDEGHDAERILITGSHAVASLTIRGQQAVGTYQPIIVNTDGALKIYDIVTGTIAAVTAITNALPTGSNAIGKLAANSGVDIGDVDVTSISAGDNNIGNVDIVTMPAVVVTSITNSIAVVPFTPAGSQMTDEGYDALRVIVAGSHAAASLAIAGSLPAGTNNIGDVDVLTIAAGDNNIGNVDVVSMPTTIAVVPVTATGGTIPDEGYDAQRILFAGAHAAASLTIRGQQAAGTYQPVIVNTDGALKIYDIVTGTINAVTGITNALPAGDNNIGNVDIVSGTVTGITNSIAVHVLSTNGTMAVNVGKIDGTIYVGFSPSRPAVLADAQHTANIFTVSGSTSGVSVSGVTLVAPSANASFKVFAFSLQTTGIVSMALKFTNGAGTSPTEFWRPLVTASATSSAPVGANLAVPPPGHLFATGVSTTLALVNDTASLVHYSVSYLKESA